MRRDEHPRREAIERGRDEFVDAVSFGAGFDCGELGKRIGRLFVQGSAPVSADDFARCAQGRVVVELADVVERFIALEALDLPVDAGARVLWLLVGEELSKRAVAAADVAGGR